VNDYLQRTTKEFDLDGNDTDTDDDRDKMNEDDITIPQLFQSVCGFYVRPNVTSPTSVNTTAFGDDDDDDNDDDDGNDDD
jgi:hypothetical protein